MTTNKESWGSRMGLILAMAGNAVGLGNFLRFPIQAIQNGGGAFIIPYLVCFVLMGIPLLWVEWAIGRWGGQRGHHATPFMMQDMDTKRPWWKYVGVFGIFTNIAIAAYYCYIESWTMGYVWKSITGVFEGLSETEVSQHFDQYVDVANKGLGSEAIIFFLFCIVLNAYILNRGLSQGVELASRIGMPLLILFAIFLAYEGITLHYTDAVGVVHTGVEGLNFLWTPQFDSLTNPKVWLAAAGQIFFTLGLGYGMIQCYAAYVGHKDDIALNAMSAGWTNEFVEVVLGSSILIPISVGYLGIDHVIELTQSGGMGLGFRTMPFLFQQYGQFLGMLGGIAFFGLLFFAAITSSLAMGSPWIAFMIDEFKWTRSQGAITFGLILLVLGFPTVWFYNEGVLDEYDYWTGTVALVVLALAESILFAWIFGMNKGWDEITRGSDIRLPKFFIPVIKYITPVLLSAVFLGSLITPASGDWGTSFHDLMAGNGWTLDNGAILAKLFHQDINAQIAAANVGEDVSQLEAKKTYLNLARGLLLAVFIGISYLVFLASRKRRLKTTDF
ncbi:MAG: sodium-dependent transporter [Spirosomataceae bacterium]